MLVSARGQVTCMSVLYTQTTDSWRCVCMHIPGTHAYIDTLSIDLHTHRPTSIELLELLA